MPSRMMAKMIAADREVEAMLDRHADRRQPGAEPEQRDEVRQHRGERHEPPPRPAAARLPDRRAGKRPSMAGLVAPRRKGRRELGARQDSDQRLAGDRPLAGA